MKKIKHLGTSLLSLVLAFSMVFSALMLPDIVHINDTKEASAKTYSFDVTSGSVNSSGINVLNFSNSAFTTLTMNVTEYTSNYPDNYDTSERTINRQIFFVKKGSYYKTYTYDKATRKLYSVYSDHFISLDDLFKSNNNKGCLEGSTSYGYGYMDISSQTIANDNPKNLINYISQYTKQFVNNHPAYKTCFENDITLKTLELPSKNYPFYSRWIANDTTIGNSNYNYSATVFTSDYCVQGNANDCYFLYSNEGNSASRVYIRRMQNNGNNRYTFMKDYNNTKKWNVMTGMNGYLGIAVTLPTEGILTPTAKSPSATLTKQSMITNTATQITDSYKLMLTDSANTARNSLTAPSIKGKNINRAAKGITYTFDVKGVNINQERSGDKKYVSAIIYDKNKNPIYYGRLAQVNNLAQKVGTVNSSSTNSAGTTVKEQTRDMSVQMTIPNDLYESDKYMLAVFEETEGSDGSRTMSSPEYANLTVSGIENIYAENAAMSGSNKGKSTEKHNNTSTEPVSDTSLVSDTKTYYDDQTITDKSNWIVEENVVNAKDVGGSVIRQEVLGANDYYVMDYDNWEYYAAYLYVKDHASEQTRYSYKIDANGNVIADTAAVNYTQCGNDKQRKTWLKLVTDEYRKSGLIKTMTNSWVPKEADMKAFDSSALGLNCLNTVHIPKLADGVTKGTKDIIFLRFHDYNGTPAFYSYKKTLQVTTQATNDTDEKTIVEADKWHTWTDGKGIEWTYMINKDGEVVYLYTKDATAMGKLIISGAHDEESYDLPENDILMIPDTINGLPVVGIGGGTKDTPLFPYITTVKDPLTAGEGVTVADSFDSITFPASVRKINDYAFYESTAGYNYQISENDEGDETATAKATGTITIPSTVKEIGNYAFYQMPYITDIMIDSDGTNINYRAFANCDRVDSIRVINSDNKGTIGERAFADNNKTRYIVVSGNVDIKARAFANNANLGKYNKKLSYGLNIDGMTGTIGFEAFADDVNLTSLYVPSTVTMEESVDKEHGYQFKGCTALKEVEYDSEKLGNNVFDGCGAITDLILGDTVKTAEASWGGSVSGKAVNRTIYVKSAATKFCFTKSGSSYSSGFGYQSGVNSGAVTVRYKDADNADIPLTDTVSGNMSSIEKKKDSNVKPHFTANGACTINFVLVGDGENVTDKDLHSQATIKGIEVTLKKGIYENSTVKKTQFIVKPEMSDSSSTDTIYDDYYMMSEDDWKAIQTAADTKRISLATKENFETAAKDARISADRFVTDKLVDDNTAAFINVVFIRYADEAGKNGYFIKKLTIPYSKLTDEAAKDQILDSVDVSSYTELAEKINELTNEVAYWREQVKELSGMTDDANASVEEMKTAMEKAQKDLADYTIMYNVLVEQMKQLNTSTETNGNGYFTDKKTDEGTVKVVYINGKELTYTETSETKDGHKLYESTGDIDGDGTEEKITYWVDENGIHVVKKNDAALENEIIYKDDIAALQRRITAQLISLQSDLNTANDLLTKIDAKIAQLKTELGITDSDFDDKSQDAQLEVIYNKVVAVNQKLVAYDNVIKSIYRQLLSEELSDEQLTNVNNVLTKMTEKITALKAENKNLSDTVIEKEAKITELNGKLTESQNTVKGLTAEIEKMKTEAASMQAKIDEQAKTLEDTKKQVDSLTASNTSLNNEITSLTSNVATLEANNQKQEEQINTLTTTLSSKDEQIANNTATIGELQGVIEQAKKDAAALRETNKEQASTIEALNTNVTNLTNIKDEQATQIAGLQENVTTLTSQNTALAENVKALTATIKEQESKIAELKEQLAAQKTLVEQLQEEASGYLLTTSEAIDMFGFDSKMSKEDMKAAIGSFVAAKTTLGKIQSAFNTDKDGDELVSFLQTNAGGSSSDTSVPTPTPSESTSADYDKGYKAGYAAGKKDGTTTIVSSSGSSNSSEVTSLTKEVTDLKTENKDLTTQVNTLSTGIEELYDAIPSEGLVGGASSVNDTMKKLGAVKTALVSMETSRENLGKQNTTLAKKVTSLDKTNKSLTATNKSLKKANSSLKSKNSKLTATNKSLATANKSLESTNNTLRVSLQNAQSVKATANSSASNTSNNVTTEPDKGTALISETGQKEQEKEQEKEDTSSKSSKSESTEATESTESTESTETKDDENVPSLSDKVNETAPIYETPEIEQDTENGNEEVSGLPSVPGDTESAEPTPDDLNAEPDRSLPIGPIAFGVVIIVGIAVLLMKKKKAKADDVDDI